MVPGPERVGARCSLLFQHTALKAHRAALLLPAQVFGVTTDPFIVYTSNLFAILSLRALYGFVASVMSDLRFLDKSVAIVLGFVGAPGG